jgi:FUN14 domain-containing protein 1
MASRYDSTIEKVAGPGTGSRVARLSHSVLDFLTADFPPRATFAAGVVLGLRIG